jgi:hypothetical protein
MTEKTPDPQVVAWMRRYLRDNPAPNDYGASNKATAMRACRQALGMEIHLRDLSDAYLAARKPLTVADIPAGQGPASLFLATVGTRDGGITASPGLGGGPLWLWFKDEDGTLLMLERAPSPTSRADFAARWDHLAATLPTVAAEEDQ